MGEGGRYLNTSVRLPPNINIIHSNNPEAAMLEGGGWRSEGVVVVVGGALLSVTKQITSARRRSLWE